MSTHKKTEMVELGEDAIKEAIQDWLCKYYPGEPRFHISWNIKTILVGCGLEKQVIMVKATR